MSRWLTCFVVGLALSLALPALGGCGGPTHAPTYQDSPAPQQGGDPLSSHRAGSASAPGSSGPASAGSSNPGSPEACNTIVNRATPVPAETDESTFPNFEGGTITPGTYVVTRVAYHTGSGGNPAGPLYPGLDETLVIDATTVQAVNVDGAVAGRWSADFSVAGTTLRWARTCPDHEAVEFGFTATATSLTLGLRMDGSDIVLSYAKLD